MSEGRATVINQIELKMKHYVDKIDRGLARELEMYSGSRFHDPLVYATEGGKRIRPIILMMSAETVGYTDDHLLDAAVAVELLHTESMIHDDIIDEETSRRGKMTFHVRYGYSSSLLTADFVFAMILAIAARYKDKRVADEISSAALQMAEGEYSELTVDPKNYKLGWDEYVKIISEKTAALFQTSAKLGGLIAGASANRVDALANYGKFVGIAYQLRDDLLDWGSQDKITRALLNDANDADVISKLRRYSETYAEKARKELAVLPENDASAFLLELTDFAVHRKR